MLKLYLYMRERAFDSFFRGEARPSVSGNVGRSAEPFKN